MAERELVQRVADDLVREVQREFPHARLELDFEHPRREDEDAYLWLTTDSQDDDEVKDLWGFAIGLVEQAYQEHDVYLVARLKGRDVIIRDKQYDTE